MKLINRVCALFLCATLCLSSLPLTAQAADPKDASKGLDFSQGFPTEETVYTAGKGTITYTPPSAPGNPHKLTLNNASISTEEGSTVPAICFAPEQIYNDFDVEIEVQGKNTITVNCSGSDTNFGRRHAIYLRTTADNHSLKIGGGGVLNLNALIGKPLLVDSSTVNAKISGEDVMGGFTSTGGDCTIKNGSKLILDGPLCRYGLFSSAGVTINKSELYLNCPFEGVGGNYPQPYVLSSEQKPVIQNGSMVTLIYYPEREATKKQPVCDNSSKLIIKAAAADYTDLEKALKEIPSDLSIYTKASVNVLNDILEKLDYNKNITEQDEVDAMVQPVYDAIAGLKLLANYSRVDKAIAKANTLKKDEYKNFSAVEEAVNAVVWDKSITEQAEVDAMAKAIEEAIAALEYKAADYSKVEEAIAKANALKKDEYKDFSAVEEAVNAVVWDKNITEQAEVDAMAKAIEDAINGLEKKQTVPGGDNRDNTDKPVTDISTPKTPAMTAISPFGLRL